MKKVGILGGMSIHSTLQYAEWLVEGIQTKLGGIHSPEMVIDCVDFEPVASMQKDGKWDDVAKILIHRAQGLEKAGADFVILATNTMHIVADKIESSISVPFLHIADATAYDIKLRKLKKVGLMGTAFTMEMDFYKGRLEKSGIDCLVPETVEERGSVHSIIYNELVKGVVNPQSRLEYKKIAQGMLARGAEGLILGCTEVNMLLKEDDFDVPVFDTTRIHVDRALNYMLA